MKSKKLSLKNLQVKSFVTGLDQNNVNTVKGGVDSDFCTLLLDCRETVVPRLCPSMICPC